MAATSRVLSWFGDIATNVRKSLMDTEPQARVETIEPEWAAFEGGEGAQIPFRGSDEVQGLLFFQRFAAGAFLATTVLLLLGVLLAYCFRGRGSKATKNEKRASDENVSGTKSKTSAPGSPIQGKRQGNANEQAKTASKSAVNVTSAKKTAFRAAVRSPTGKRKSRPSLATSLFDSPNTRVATQLTIGNAENASKRSAPRTSSDSPRKFRPVLSGTLSTNPQMQQTQESTTKDSTRVATMAAEARPAGRLIPAGRCKLPGIYCASSSSNAPEKHASLATSHKELHKGQDARYQFNPAYPRDLELDTSSYDSLDESTSELNSSAWSISSDSSWSSSSSSSSSSSYDSSTSYSTSYTSGSSSTTYDQPQARAIRAMTTVKLAASKKPCVSINMTHVPFTRVATSCSSYTRSVTLGDAEVGEEGVVETVDLAPAVSIASDARDMSKNVLNNEGIADSQDEIEEEEEGESEDDERTVRFATLPPVPPCSSTSSHMEVDENAMDVDGTNDEGAAEDESRFVRVATARIDDQASRHNSSVKMDCSHSDEEEEEEEEDAEEAAKEYRITTTHFDVRPRGMGSSPVGNAAPSSLMMLSAAAESEESDQEDVEDQQDEKDETVLLVPPTPPVETNANDLFEDPHEEESTETTKSREEEQESNNSVDSMLPSSCAVNVSSAESISDSEIDKILRDANQPASSGARESSRAFVWVQKPQASSKLDHISESFLKASPSNARPAVIALDDDDDVLAM